MKKYRCTICGYIYDDEKEKVKFEDLPDDWKCPACGAPKSLFLEVKEEKDEEKFESNSSIIEDVADDLRELSNYEISLICSNLVKSSEKQYLDEESNLFRELSKYYESLEDNKSGSLDDVIDMVNSDINSFSRAMDVFTKCDDRGAKRVVNWASKSTNIMKVVMDTYKEKGIDYIKNTKIWVCDICGFVYIGDNPPKVCPVCRVPSLKILEVC